MGANTQNLPSEQYFSRCTCPCCDGCWKEISAKLYANHKRFMENHADAYTATFTIARVTIPPQKKRLRVAKLLNWVNLNDGERRVAAFYYRKGGNWRERLERWLDEHPEYEVDRKILDKIP